MIYVDSSALVKRYVREHLSDVADAMLLADPEWVTAEHTFVEVSLALARRLDEAAMDRALLFLDADWRRTAIVTSDHDLSLAAVRMGRQTGMPTLDALHLAAAERVAGRSVPIVTFDQRLARSARAIGFGVLGA
ncbi:hypothetical protein BH23CHL8_BH23CHL8_13460 [soil metagenome]